MKKILLFAILFSLLEIANAQETTFQKCFGGNNFEYGYSMQKTNDGGCIVGGYTSSYGIATGQYYVVKFDVKGIKQWAKTYGGSCGKAQPINDIWQTTDAGYVFTGYSDCVNSTNTANAYIVRTKPNGDTLWTRAWGGNTAGKYSDAYEIAQANDGNILVGGYTTSYGAGGEDAFLIKLNDANGDTLWTKVWGGPLKDWMYYLQPTKDGGVMLCGLTNSFGQGNSDVLLIKTDKNGNIQWSKAYGTTNSEFGFGHCAQQTMDGGYIIVSNTGYLIKTDTNGKIIWQKQYIGSFALTCHSVEQTSDKGYIFGGYNSAGGSNRALLVKTDSNGNVMWSKLYGDTSECLAVKQANDKGFYFTGQINNRVQGTDAYLVKTDSNGLSGCKETNAGINAINGNYIETTVKLTLNYGPQTRTVPSYVNSGYSETLFCLELGSENRVNQKLKISVYPNPFSSKTTLQGNKIFKNASLTIYNLFGQPVKQITNISGPAITLYRGNFPAGLYFFTITQDNEVIAKDKFVITKN